MGEVGVQVSIWRFDSADATTGVSLAEWSTGSSIAGDHSFRTFYTPSTTGYYRFYYEFFDASGKQFATDWSNTLYKYIPPNKEADTTTGKTKKS